MKKQKKKNKSKIIIPLYETNPIVNAEKGNEKTLDDAIEMAKKWVEETKL